MMNTNNANKIKKEIPIFFASDDNYVPFLVVAIDSMLKNASKNYIYSIKVLTTGLCEESKIALEKFVSNDVSVEIVDVTEAMKSLSDQLHTRDYYSKSTYFRLFIPRLYPQYKKAIYLDADIVVTGDISKMFNINIGNNLVGAVPDGAVQATPVFIEYVEKVLGVKGKKYFNAGILLMNLDQFRKQNFEQKFVELLGKYTFTVAQDQDYLNVICAGKVTYIDESWDKMPIPMGNCDPAKQNIIHYNMGWKPWHTDGVLFEEIFWNYAKQTQMYEKILKIKENYTPADLLRDQQQGAALLAMCRQEADSPVNYYNLYIKNSISGNGEPADQDFDSEEIPAKV